MPLSSNFSTTPSADGKTLLITPASKGDTEFTAKVVDFNEADKKISLSVKAMFAPEPTEEVVEEDADVVAVDIDAVIASEDAE